MKARGAVFRRSSTHGPDHAILPLWGSSSCSRIRVVGEFPRGDFVTILSSGVGHDVTIGDYDGQRYVQHTQECRRRERRVHIRRSLDRPGHKDRGRGITRPGSVVEGRARDQRCSEIRTMHARVKMTRCDEL